MASYNRVIIMGNLTRDPEVKQLSSGQSVCRLGLASNRQFKNRQTGAMVQEVCFIDVDVWGAQADSCKQYLQKGRGVLIEGRLKLDSWTDNDGNRRSKHSIVADRVTFLASSSQEAGYEYGETEVGGQEQEPEEIKPAKAAAKKKTTKAAADTAGEVSFGDQEPFEDDLPF